MKIYYKLGTFLLCIAITLKFIHKKKYSKVIEPGLYSLKKNSFIYHGKSIQSNKSVQILHDNYPIYIIQVKEGWVKVKDSKEVLGWTLKKNISTPYALVLKSIKHKKDTILPGVYLPFIKKEKKCIVMINNNEAEIDCNDIWIG